MSDPIILTPDTVEARLPDVPRLARSAFRFASELRRGTLDITLPDGRVLRCGGCEPGPAAEMTVHDYGFAWRLARGGDIGIAEAYLRREWDTPDPHEIPLYLLPEPRLIQTMLGDKPLARIVQLVRHWLNRNTRRQARRNIFAHYDIGNSFYSAWLDPSMTYSSALFEDDTEDLTAAQHNKYRRLAEAINLQPGQSVLEIGCGWGGFAEYVAKTYDARVVGLTISTEQRDFAQQRMQAAGLADKVEIRLQDYRDERGRYDRIASIEMIEAVGEQFWPPVLLAAPRPPRAGRLRRHPGHHHPGPLLQRLPARGGLHPALRVPRRHAAVAAGAEVARREVRRACHPRAHLRRRLCQDARDLGDNFRAAWPSLTPLGFDERFRRLWEYYLAYCEAGFLSGNIDVRQVVFAKTD